jgi:hypothetical protein
MYRGIGKPLKKQLEMKLYSGLGKPSHIEKLPRKCTSPRVNMFFSDDLPRPFFVFRDDSRPN